MGLLLLAALIVTPLIEIGLFIQVGEAIGLWPTLATVVATAVIGAALLRRQGVGVVAEIQRKLDRAEAPIEELWRGALLILAGALLLTPGFFTDAIGFALLVPAVQRAVGRFLARRLAESKHVHVHMGGGAPRRPPPGGPGPHPPAGARPGRPSGPVIDAEWRDAPRANDDGPANEDGPPPGPKGQGDSPWRRGSD